MIVKILLRHLLKHIKEYHEGYLGTKSIPLKRTAEMNEKLGGREQQALGM
jgi:hypothetical protein